MNKRYDAAQEVLDIHFLEGDIAHQRFGCPEPDMEAVKATNVIIVRGEASRDPQYRHRGVLVSRAGELMVITSILPNQFNPHPELLPDVEQTS